MSARIEFLKMNTETTTILVLGGTGKTGSRVIRRLRERQLPVRVGSRSEAPPFDWEKPSTWAPALKQANAVYVTYYPDLAIPGAVEKGARRLVLLSGRGEKEAQRAEQAVRDSGADWTILRVSWFNQNFSENYLLEPLLMGEVILPAGDIPEPFIDAEDIADAAVAALTEDGHVGKLYEMTGQRLLTFADAVAEIAKACDRNIRYQQVSVEEYEVPSEFVWLLKYLFSNVLDGRNAHITDGVRRALARPPRDFGDYVRETAAAGGWNRQSPV